MTQTTRPTGPGQPVRAPRGTPTGGQFVATGHAEADLALDPRAAVEVMPHELAHLGISTVLRADGTVVARNTIPLPCPVCAGDRDRQATCAECVGRGVVNDVPFCEREWDEVLTTETGGSLWLGGHDAQEGGGDCKPEAQFDLVVSLYSRDGYEPAEGVEHLQHTMVDGDLDDGDHSTIDRLATRVNEVLDHGPGEPGVGGDWSAKGGRVLVRCQGGMNRSGLVAGLAAIKRGVPLDDFLAEARAARGPWVLFNQAFVAHLREREIAEIAEIAAHEARADQR